MRRRANLVTIALALAALAGLAAAQTATLWIPADATVQGACHALLIHSEKAPLRLDRATITGANVRIIDHALEWIEGPYGDAYVVDRPIRDDYVAKNARITLAPGQRGHLGLHPQDHCEATYTPDQPAAAIATSDSHLTTLNDGSLAPDNNPPDAYYYGHRQIGKHVLATGTGHVTLRATGTVQIMGAVVLVNADNTAPKRHETGHFADDRPITYGETRWITIQGDNLTLDLASPRIPILAAYHTLQGDGFVVDGTGATFTPPSRNPLLGALPTNGGLPLAGGTLLLALLIAGTGAHLLHRHRRLQRAHDAHDPTLLAVHDPHEEWDAEECLARAETHIENERFDRALPWIERARLLAPTSSTATATHAFLLGILGHHDKAIDLYEQASLLAPHDGEHLLAAARLAHQTGKPPETVEDLLQRALDRDPNLIREFDPEDEFQDLSERDPFQAILGHAWERVLGERADGETE